MKPSDQVIEKQNENPVCLNKTWNLEGQFPGKTQC